MEYFSFNRRLLVVALNTYKMVRCENALLKINHLSGRLSQDECFLVVGFLDCFLVFFEFYQIGLPNMKYNNVLGNGGKERKVNLCSVLAISYFLLLPLVKKKTTNPNIFSWHRTKEKSDTRDKQLLSICCVPGTVLVIGDINTKKPL